MSKFLHPEHQLEARLTEFARSYYSNNLFTVIWDAEADVYDLFRRSEDGLSVTWVAEIGSRPLGEGFLRFGIRVLKPKVTSGA